MLRILLIEDEPLAMNQLVSMINSWNSETEIVGKIESVVEGKKWIKENPWPDLIISDVQLSDGLSINIFKSGVPNTCKIVFATAFDQYAIDAFRLQAQDYLLKPIEEAQFHKVLSKINASQPSVQIDYNELAEMVVKKMQRQHHVYLIRFNNQLIELNSKNIAFLYIEDRNVMAQTFNGQKLPMDGSLDQYEKELDSNIFFRANRSCIINHKAISKIKSYSNSKLLLISDPPHKEEDIIISKEKSPIFKQWLSERKSFEL